MNNHFELKDQLITVFWGENNERPTANDFRHVYHVFLTDWMKQNNMDSGLVPLYTGQI